MSGTSGCVAVQRVPGTRSVVNLTPNVDAVRRFKRCERMEGTNDVKTQDDCQCR